MQHYCNLLTYMVYSGLWHVFTARALHGTVLVLIRWSCSRSQLRLCEQKD